jgi:CO/xanthine dehydrogenase Mo-binding subunit
VVICSEVPGNPGTSVTNALEGAVRATADTLGIAPDELTVFEHYPTVIASFSLRPRVNG